MTLDRFIAIVRLRARSLLSRNAVERELDDELRYHLDRQIDANLAQGMTPAEARTAALRALGGLEPRKEQVRDTRGIVVPIEGVLRDIGLAARQLRRQPGFTVTAVLSLALGIGANTAIFQLINALTLRPLPIPAPHELAEVRLTGDGRDGRHNGRNRQVSLPQFREIERHQQVFSSMFAFSDTRFNLSPSGAVRYVDALWVSGGFFDTLRVRPHIGRVIGPADDRDGCRGNTVAVISYALWQSEFGGRADILDQTLPSGSSRIPIVGVTPPGFFGVEVGRQFGVALPLCASGYGDRDHWWLAAGGRLKSGVSHAAATAQLSQVREQILKETMPPYRADLAQEYMAMGIEVVDASAGVSPLRRSYEQPLWILMAISALVLVMAAVNLANLLLARGAARRAEFAVRLAIGGSRLRVLQQVLIEVAMLVAGGAVTALGVAIVVSRSIPPLISTTYDRIYLDLPLVDWRPFGFTSLASVVVALVVGSAPAWRASRTSVVPGVQRGAAGNDGLRLRRALVAAQMAMTLVLLFASLLFGRTFRNLSASDIGVSERGVVMAVAFFNAAQYPPERRVDAYRALDERIFNMPGIESAAEAYTTPMGGNVSDFDVVSDAGESGSSYGNRVSAGYFRTLGTPLLAGRDFDGRDGPGATRVALVSQSFASRFFDGNALGRRFTVPNDRGGAGTEYEVIGIVGNQVYLDLRETHPPIAYFASAQLPEQPLQRRYVIRAAAPPQATIAAVGAAIASFDPSLTVRYSLIDTQIAEGMLRERLMARLSGLFGALSLGLAVVGLYGLVAYSVAMRRAEIGVRVALGASRRRILSMMLGDVAVILIAGLTMGSVVAMLAGRAVRSLLYGLDAGDITTLAGAAGVLAICGLLAAAWPARRAAGIDPVTALRES